MTQIGRIFTDMRASDSSVFYRNLSAFIMPKPCGFSTPRTRMPAGIRQGLRPLRTLVHVCQCAGIRVHAIDWRDSRRGHALQRRDSGRHYLRLIFVSLSDIIRKISKHSCINLCELCVLCGENSALPKQVSRN